MALCALKENAERDMLGDHRANDYISKTELDVKWCSQIANRNGHDLIHNAHVSKILLFPCQFFLATAMDEDRAATIVTRDHFAALMDGHLVMV